MRVILTQPVPKLGEVGDVCEVAPGYGRNYLLPQGMAVLATKGALKQIDDLKRTEGRRQDALRGTFETLASRIESTHLAFTAKVGETGRLYGSITSLDIAEQLEERLGEPVDRRKILLDEPIKALGEHEVAMHLMPGVDTTIHLTVDADSEIMEDVGLTEEYFRELEEEAAAAGAEAAGAPEDESAPEEEPALPESEAPL